VAASSLIDPVAERGVEAGTAGATLMLDPGENDLRGKGVLDASGEMIGTVEDVFVDGNLRRVRFLLVAGSGVPGMGDEKRTIPVESIDRTEGDVVQIKHPRERVAFSPRYSGRQVDQPSFWNEVYRWYGHAPAGLG
jgi:sporulation protein YlmC with PRC-barrel domain